MLQYQLETCVPTVMKLTIALFACLASAVFVAAKSGVSPDPAVRGISLIGPAPDYECSENGAFPHEINCELFYDCYNDLANLMACTENTLFETSYGGCGAAEDVDCGERLRPNGTTNPIRTTTSMRTTGLPPTGTPGPGEPECTPDHHGAYFPNTLYCEKYFQCDNYDAIPFTCRDDLLFSTVFMGCDFPESVDCGDRLRPDYTGPTRSTVRTTTRDPSITEGPPYDCDPEHNGAFPHENCEKYWDCYNGVATLMNCPGDFLFETVWFGCETPETVDCGDRIRPNGTTQRPTNSPRPTTPTTVGPTGGPTTTQGVPTTTPGGPVFECQYSDGNFPDPENCRSFYQCANWVPYKVTCPGQILVYDDIQEVCNFPDQVDCGTRPIIPGVH